MTQIELLKTVLIFLANDERAKPKISDGDLFSALRKKYPGLERQNDLGSALHRILNKLNKQGCVDFGPPEELIRTYKITLMGKPS